MMTCGLIDQFLHSLPSMDSENRVAGGSSNALLTALGATLNSTLSMKIWKKDYSGNTTLGSKVAKFTKTLLPKVVFILKTHSEVSSTFQSGRPEKYFLENCLKTTNQGFLQLNV